MSTRLDVAPPHTVKVQHVNFSPSTHPADGPHAASPFRATQSNIGVHGDAPLLQIPKLPSLTADRGRRTPKLGNPNRLPSQPYLLEA